MSDSHPTRELPDPGRDLRRLRAALGASADALLTRRADPAALLSAEAAFLTAISRALGRPDVLAELWRDLRNRALALAADLEPGDRSAALLRAQLEADEHARGTPGPGSPGQPAGR